MKQVKVNYQNLINVKESYNGTGTDSALDSLNEIEDYCNKIEEWIDEIDGEAAKKAEKRLEDIRDSIRGLNTSFGDMVEDIDKYMNRMEPKLTGVDEEKDIFVKSEIKDLKDEIKNLSQETKSALRANIHLVNCVTVKSENRDIKHAVNITIDNYNDQAKTLKLSVDEKFESAKMEIEKLIEWNEDDFKVLDNIDKPAIFALEIALSIFVPGGFLIVGAIDVCRKVEKMYSHGYSLEGAIVGGVVVGGVDAVVGKAGGALGSRISKSASGALKSSTTGLENMSKELGNKLMGGTKHIDWAKNKVSNMSYAHFINTESTGISYTKYIDSESFLMMQNKYKLECDNVFTDVHIDVNKTLNDALSKYENNYKNLMKDIDTKVVQYTKNTNEAIEIISDYMIKERKKPETLIEYAFQRESVKEVASEIVIDSSIESIVEEMNQNQADLSDKIRIHIETQFIQGMI